MMISNADNATTMITTSLHHLLARLDNTIELSVGGLMLN
jgi:hypothetical protein